MLRSGEAAALLRQHLVLPCDGSLGDSVRVVAITLPKSSARCAFAKRGGGRRFVVGVARRRSGTVSGDDDTMHRWRREVAPKISGSSKGFGAGRFAIVPRVRPRRRRHAPLRALPKHRSTSVPRSFGNQKRLFDTTCSKALPRWRCQASAKKQLLDAGVCRPSWNRSWPIRVLEDAGFSPKSGSELGWRYCVKRRSRFNCVVESMAVTTTAI